MQTPNNPGKSKTVTIKSIDDYIRLVNKSNPDYKEGNRSVLM